MLKKTLTGSRSIMHDGIGHNKINFLSKSLFQFPDDRKVILCRTDLPTGSYAEIMKSLERLLTELPEDTAVFPGHGPGTTIGYEKRIEGF